MHLNGGATSRFRTLTLVLSGRGAVRCARQKCKGPKVDSFWPVYTADFPGGRNSSRTTDPLLVRPEDEEETE